MSSPVTPGDPNRKLLIGAGVGCGCLSLIVGIVAIIFIFSSLGRTQSQPPPQPQPQPAQPQPAQPQPAPPQPAPQPAPQGEGIEGVKVQLAMVKVQGEGDNARPGAPTDTFVPGETAAAFGTFVEVRGTHEIYIYWFKVEGDKLAPVAKPHVFTISDNMQGKPFFFRLGGIVAGDFIFGILKSTGPEQFQRVAIRRFRVQ
jgi:hypothetical protein